VLKFPARCVERQELTYLFQDSSRSKWNRRKRASCIISSGNISLRRAVEILIFHATTNILAAAEVTNEHSFRDRVKELSEAEYK
jgi:hypothetical protein